MVIDLFRPSSFIRPRDIQEVLSALEEEPAAKIIAGGTDLLVEKNPTITCLIDVSRLPLNYVDRSHEIIRIGSCATLRNVERSSILQTPSLFSIVEAARSIGGVAIRNVATVGGNLCNAVPSADMPPPLIALDSQVRVLGRGGEREMALENFFTNVRKTALAPGEMLIEVDVPVPAERTGSSFVKLGRAAHDIAVVNAAARVTLKDEICESARIVLGAVAPIPMRACKAESVLEGRRLNASLIAEAARVAASEAKPISDVRASVEYRTDMCRVLVERALERAVLRASGEV